MTAYREYKVNVSITQTWNEVKNADYNFYNYRFIGEIK